MPFDKFNPFTKKLDFSSPSGVPGGSTTQIQYNNAGAFTGDSNLVWNAATGALGIGTVPSNRLHVIGAGVTAVASISNADGSGNLAKDYALKVLSTAGNSNGTNKGLYVEASGASASLALTVVGDTSLSGILNMNQNPIANLGNSQIGGSASSTNGTLRLFANTATAFNFNNGGTLTLAGDTGETGVAGRAVFASVQGIKENASYLNSLGALLFGAQSSASDSAGLSTVTERMRITSSGNVGIGTSDPLARLSVKNQVSSTVVATIQGAASQAGNLLELQNSSGTVLTSFLPTGAQFISNQATPATPTGGGVIFVNAGALKYIGSSGTVTTIAAA